jgi:transcriptional regulator with XRE-family HTH domain
MESVGTRIRTLRKRLDKTQAEFAETLGLKNGIVSVWELDKIEIDDKTIKAICHNFGVNEAWLRKGHGEMFDKVKTESEVIEKFRKLPCELQDLVLRYIDTLVENDSVIQHFHSQSSKPE